jgi:molybdate transport system ATP-binding protein
MSLEVAIRHTLGSFALDAAFKVDAPGVTALFGPSGSGKSSAVNAIAGLLRPREGRILINGVTVVDTAQRVFLPARRRRVGYVFQDSRLFPHLSVQANLEFGAKRSPEPPGPAEIRQIVDLLALGPLLARKPATLSGGERQRVALGRAVLAKPRILLLDEPLAALDAARKAEILPYLERLRDEARLPIVYVSHAIDEVARLADQMIVMDAGRIVAQGSVFDVLARLDLAPITGRLETGAVIDARIAAHHAAERLTEVAFDDGRLWIPEIDGGVGARVRVRIRARDVMLALGEPQGISANNVVRGTVAAIRADQGTYQDVLLACGQARLIASITQRSLARLAVRPGQELYAVIKSVTVDRTATSLAPR